MKDELFIRGNVPMTKEDVRVLALEYLELADAQTFIDIGAGTGSICIEASLRYPHMRTIAIERNPEAIELIRLNRDKFGVKNLDIIEGCAPVDVSVSLADAIFIGGSGGNLEEIIDWSFIHLVDGGRLILNFILLENLTEALGVLKGRDFSGIEVKQIQVSHLTQLGKGHYFKPGNPTYIISCYKGQ